MAALSQKAKEPGNLAGIGFLRPPRLRPACGRSMAPERQSEPYRGTRVSNLASEVRVRLAQAMKNDRTSRRVADCAIGDGLRDHYEPTLRDPVPKRFLELLQRADEHSLARAAERTSSQTKVRRQSGPQN